MSSYHVSDSRKGLTKEELDAELRCFQKHFPGKRLLALRFDGFSHAVVYDDGTADSQPTFVYVSFCMSEDEELCHAPESRRESQKAARDFLTDIHCTGHSAYQGNAVEITFVEPDER